MDKTKKMPYPDGENLRLNPEARLCPQYDRVTVKKFRAPEQGEMGFRVVDNFPEEHIQ